MGSDGSITLPITLDAIGFSSTAVVQYSSLCLEDPAKSTADGTQYQQDTCGSGEEQRFDFHPVTGATDTYTVVDHSSGKCLDISAYSTSNGAAVQQWTCHGGTNQRFTLRAVTALGNGHDCQLVAVNSGKCVDVSDISTAVGALVHQWTCDTEHPDHQEEPDLEAHRQGRTKRIPLPCRTP